MKRWLALILAAASTATAQQDNPEVRLAPQREAMQALDAFNGAWRGPATIRTRDGVITITQTERFGPMLGGSVRVMEGRGTNTDGALSFNALGIVSYDSARKTYTLHSYAQGYSGDYVLVPQPGGFDWSMTMPDGSAIKYVARIEGGQWHEVGTRVAPDGTTVQFFEMRLDRIGDSDWPAAGAIAPK